VGLLNPTETIAHLQKLGVTMTVDGGKLRVEAPAGVVTQDMAQYLRRHKRIILAALQGEAVTLADYLALLRDSITSPDLPPVPPFSYGDPKHGAAWAAWWKAVEAQRTYRSASK